MVGDVDINRDQLDGADKEQFIACDKQSLVRYNVGNWPWVDQVRRSSSRPVRLVRCCQTLTIIMDLPVSTGYLHRGGGALSSHSRGNIGIYFVSSVQCHAHMDVFLRATTVGRINIVINIIKYAKIWQEKTCHVLVIAVCWICYPPHPTTRLPMSHPTVHIQNKLYCFRVSENISYAVNLV